jgi:hypothetical protein
MVQSQPRSSGAPGTTSKRMQDQSNKEPENKTEETVFRRALLHPRHLEIVRDRSRQLGKTDTEPGNRRESPLRGLNGRLRIFQAAGFVTNADSPDSAPGSQVVVSASD